jgi:hypothetical protein
VHGRHLRYRVLPRLRNQPNGAGGQDSWSDSSDYAQVMMMMMSNDDVVVDDE